MERAGEEDDTGSGSRRRSRSRGGSDATSTMSDGGTTAVKQHQALRLVEDLSLPSVQVVVMSANMGCSHCRQRVTKVVTKMNAGLLDYMVDFGKKEVTVRGTVIHTKKKKRKKQQQYMITGLEKVPPANMGARTLSWFLGCYGS
ncbi:hypothetical protein CFC21_043664 [Triticum aestivum]|uniref:HMA domain-containing protein n=2 Tax=Triticum aestivum TaxID=4565 RepID=A0A9R1FQ25_WHEAT|nr:uncharacterized protein LOC123072099 isoform X1 [Triticum aestivum]KAF7032498.1 hypothetical protein CFC21_043664 [Triticum aestivum]CDM85861.1 unnamed protein product [Triticum aestivum]